MSGDLLARVYELLALARDKLHLLGKWNTVKQDLLSLQVCIRCDRTLSIFSVSEKMGHAVLGFSFDKLTGRVVSEGHAIQFKTEPEVIAVPILKDLMAGSPWNNMFENRSACKTAPHRNIVFDLEDQSVRELDLSFFDPLLLVKFNVHGLRAGGEMDLRTLSSIKKNPGPVRGLITLETYGLQTLRVEQGVLIIIRT